MPPEIKDLATLFLEVGQLDPQRSLYLNEEAPYGRNSLCMVVSNNSEEKDFAAENGFYPVFEIATVQKIVIKPVIAFLISHWMNSLKHSIFMKNPISFRPERGAE